MRWSVIVAVASVIVFARTASAQQAPIIVEADVITYDAVEQVVTAQGNVRAALRPYRLLADSARYDLRTGIVVATGRVRLVDPEGQELRGQTLTYNTRADEGVLERFEGILQRRVYVRGGRLGVTPERIVGQESTVTTCDPRRPLYRVVARRIEIVPNREIIAHDASLYLGNVRLITLPRLSISLRPGEDVRLPNFGYNEIDGYWIDYRLPVRFAGGGGEVLAKYGSLSGPFALLSLAYGFPGYTIATRLGRTQTNGERQSGNLLPYEVAEVSAVTRPARIGSLPISWSFYGAAGWYAERQPGITTTRLDGEVSFTPNPIVVSSNLTLNTRIAYRVSSYGMGSERTITTLSATLSYGLDRFTSLEVGYSYADVQGRTPLNIDVVDSARTYFLGGFRAVPDRYRVGAFIFYNAIVPETTLKIHLGLVILRNLEVGLFADYNLRTTAFAELNYSIRYICDCIEVMVRYRQIQREISLEFGLTGFGGTTPIVPRTETPPLQFPDRP